MTFEVIAPVRPWASSVLQRASAYPRPATTDVLVAVALGLAAAIATLIGYYQLAPAIMHYGMWDFWFESDPARTFMQAVDRHSTYHYSTSHHPLFSLIVFPPVFFLGEILKLGDETAFGALLAAVSALSIATVYATLRIFNLKRLDAAIFTALMATSAAAVFWFPVPETWSLGALSILMVITVCAVSEQNDGLPTWVYLVASVAALSVTTTNWLAALAMLFVFLDRKTAIVQAAKTLVIVMALQTLQHGLFPHAASFTTISKAQEINYVFNDAALGVIPKLYGFFFHSIVIPDVGMSYGSRLSVQGAVPGDGSVLALAAVLIWAALLVLGCWSIFRLMTAKTPFRFRKTTIVLLVALAGHLLITTAFGIEAFLYALHFAPLMIVLVALSALTPARPVAVPLALVLAVMAGVNSYAKFTSSAEQLADRFAHERRFAAVFNQHVEPGALTVCGGEALGATGEAGTSRPTPAAAPIEPINPALNPDTCLIAFDDAVDGRLGWMRWYEDWSLEAIETFAARGARYFATSYAYGLEHRKDLFDALDARFKRLARTPSWAIYDLTNPTEREHVEVGPGVPKGPSP